MINKNKLNKLVGIIGIIIAVPTILGLLLHTVLPDIPLPLSIFVGLMGAWVCFLVGVASALTYDWLKK